MGIKPLSISPIRTIKAYFFPASLSTLVAPGFLDPSVRGSGRLKSLQTIIAEQSEPAKYANGIMEIISNRCINMIGS